MMEEFPHGYFFWKKAQFDLGMNHKKSQVTVLHNFVYFGSVSSSQKVRVVRMYNKYNIFFTIIGTINTITNDKLLFEYFLCE